MTTIGIDLGGTKVAVALFDENGNILFKNKSDVFAAKGKEVGRIIASALGEVMEESKTMGLSPGGIGISVPGIAHRSGDVWAPNISGWEKYPIKKEIESEIRNICGVYVESDRACHLMGEVWKGAARGCSNAIFLAVGTGIGAGIMTEGQILTGSNGISGSIGWMALRPPYDPTNYKERGCFESYASGHGITERACALLRDGTSSVLKSRKVRLTAEDVFDAFAEHDPLAVKVIDDAIQFWGMAAANLVSLFNPEKIIFGGGVFGPAAKLIDQIYKEALQWAQPISMKQVKFEASQLGGNAGLIGAGYLAGRAKVLNC